MKKTTLEERALNDVRMMWNKLEFAAMLKHPVLGLAVTETLQDTNPRMLRTLQNLNKSLEQGK